MVSWNLFNKNQLPTFSNREAERQERLCGYRRVWEAYLGEMPDALVVEKGEVNDNVKINPSQAIIDTGNYFLFGRPIKFHVHPDESTDGAKVPKPKAGQKPLPKPGEEGKEGEENRFSEDGESDDSQKPESERGKRPEGDEREEDKKRSEGGQGDREKRPEGEERDNEREPREGEDRERKPQGDGQRSEGSERDEAEFENRPETDDPPGDVSQYSDDQYPNASATQQHLTSDDAGGEPKDREKKYEEYDKNAGPSDKFEKGEKDEKGGKPGFGGKGKFGEGKDGGKGEKEKKFGMDPNFENPQAPEKPQDPPWMKQLNRAWKANSKHQFLMNLGKSGGIHGDVFVKFVPNAAGTMNQYPRLILLDPATIDVITDPNDVDKVIQYTISYITEDSQNDYTREVCRIQRITQAEDGQSWEIADFEQQNVFQIGQGWSPGTNPEIPVGEVKTWPYPWPPIEHCQNIALPHMFWGQPDLNEASVEVLQSLQRAMSTLSKIVRIHSSPRLFAKNVMPDMLSEIDISPENIIALPQMDAELSVLTVLDNLTSALEFTNQVKADLLEMVRVPAIALGHVEDAASAASGINMSVLYSPLIQKTEEKQITYGDMLVRISQKMLVLMGEKFTEEMEDLCVEWPECMPGSKYLERQTLQQDLQMGASPHTILSRLGYNADEEEQRNMQVKQQETQMQMSADMQINSSRFGDQQQFRAGQSQNKGGGNNNPSGFGNKSGSMGAANKNTPKKNY